MFKYEMHVHSREGSACGSSGIRELVRAYHRAGYQGLVLTDHFVHGNTAIARDLPWPEQMQRYYDVYLLARQEAENLDFDVIFGLEDGYGQGKEVLIYGIDLAFLVSHPELDRASLADWTRLAHEAGGLVIHAHPHRDRAYVTPNVAPRYDLCDGLEVYNAGDSHAANAKARADGGSLGLIQTSGGDTHWVDDGKIGLAGMLFPERIRNGQALVQALRSGCGQPILNGAIQPETL